MELPELARDIAVDLRDGVDGVAATRDRWEVSDTRGLFVACESAAESTAPTGRFLAGGAWDSSSLPARSRSLSLSFSRSLSLSRFAASFRAGGNARIFLTVGRNCFGMSSVTRSFRRGPGLAGSSLPLSDAGSFLIPSASLPSLLLSSDGSGDALFFRRNSISTAGGSVGDSNGGMTAGGRFFLLKGSASLFFVFAAGAASLESSRFFLRAVGPSSPSPRVRFWSSKLKCSGESKGGTNDLEASDLVGVPRLLPPKLGRTPFVESPRGRAPGDGFRAVFTAPFGMERPLGNEDEEDSRSSFGGRLSRALACSLSLRRCGSSLFDSGGGRSSMGRLSSGFERFWGRNSSSTSTSRFLAAGDGGFGGNEGGLGGRLDATLATGWGRADAVSVRCVWAVTSWPRLAI